MSFEYAIAVSHFPIDDLEKIYFWQSKYFGISSIENLNETTIM